MHVETTAAFNMLCSVIHKIGRYLVSEAICDEVLICGPIRSMRKLIVCKTRIYKQKIIIVLKIERTVKKSFILIFHTLLSLSLTSWSKPNKK